jgi:hypothetical protein
MDHNSPSYKVLRFRSKLNIFREVKSLTPVDNLSIRVMSLFCTKRWPANLTFKHNCSKTPPVTVEGVPIAAEDLWSDIIWGTHGRIRHDSSRLSPVIDGGTVAYSKIDLIKIDRITIPCSASVAWLALQKLLIIRIVMESVESR